jgi:hypothetical protein
MKVALAHMAGVTNRIEFLTGMLILPQRQTMLVARQAAGGTHTSIVMGRGFTNVEQHVGHLRELRRLIA